MVVDPEHRSGLGGNLFERFETLDPLLRGDLGALAYQALACIYHEKRKKEYAEKLAYEDSVAGCLSRAVFEKYADDFDPSRLGDSDVGVVYVDLNDFKEVNDTRGHEEGDELLQSLASCLKGQFRKGDAVFRMGGDEFCVVCPISQTEEDVDFDKKEQLLVRAEHARSILMHENGANFAVGAAVFDADLDEGDIRNTVERADREMYVDKQTIKNIEDA